MGAHASVSSHRTIFSMLSISLCASGLLLLGGCCHDDKDKEKTAEETAPPPQSISEPVKAPEAAPIPEPTLPPAIPVSVDEFGNQKPGETKDLPSFVPPAAPQPAPAAVKPVPAPVEAQRDGKGRFHILQKGETLYGLARQYNVKAQKIIELNQFKDPNRLSAGTKVYIPD